MTASNNPNGLRTVLPNAGGSFAVQGSEIFANTIDNTCIAANTIGNAQVAPNLIQTASVTLTPAQVVAMYATPEPIIAAPASGSSIVVLGALCRYVYNTHAFTSGGNVQLQYGTTNHAGGTTPLTVVADTVLQATSNSDTQMQQAATTTTVTQATGLYASCATAFAIASGGLSTVTFIVQYVVV